MVSANDDWKMLKLIWKTGSTPWHMLFEKRQNQIKNILLSQEDLLPLVLLNMIVEYGIRTWKNFERGDLLSIVDTVGTKYGGIILAVKQNAIFVHYICWNHDWDEWIFFDTEHKCKRLGPLDHIPVVVGDKESIYGVRRRINETLLLNCKIIPDLVDHFFH